MPLVLVQLEDSIRFLRDLLAVAENESRMGMFTDVERAGIQGGVIKNFEITYELSWKLMARWLNMHITPGIADGVTRRELFRLASQSRLIADVDQWMRHHEARNRTVHIYNREQALQAYRATADFLDDARCLLGRLREGND